MLVKGVLINFVNNKRHCDILYHNTNDTQNVASDKHGGHHWKTVVRCIDWNFNAHQFQHISTQLNDCSELTKDLFWLPISFSSRETPLMMSRVFLYSCRGYHPVTFNNLVRLSDAIWQHTVCIGQHWFRSWIANWRQHGITEPSADLIAMGIRINFNESLIRGNHFQSRKCI